MVVSPMHRPPLPPRRYVWYSLLLDDESTTSQYGGPLDHINKNFNDPIRNRERELPVCIAVLITRE